jgi:hypothetical protein
MFFRDPSLGFLYFKSKIQKQIFCHFSTNKTKKDGDTGRGNIPASHKYKLDTICKNEGKTTIKESSSKMKIVVCTCCKNTSSNVQFLLMFFPSHPWNNNK